MKIRYTALIVGAVVILVVAIAGIDMGFRVSWENTLPREVKLRVVDTRGGNPVTDARVAMIDSTALASIPATTLDECTSWKQTSSDGTTTLTPRISARGTEGPIWGVQAFLELDHTILIRDTTDALRHIDAARCLRGRRWDFRTQPLELEVPVDETHY